MPELNRQEERLIGLFIVGVIVLNYPLLSLFSRIRLVFGVPILYLYLFLFWAVFIFCLAFILEKPGYLSLTIPSSKQDKPE